MLLLLALVAPALAHDHWIEPRPVRGGVAVHVQLGEHLTGAEPHRVKGPGGYARFGIYSRVGFRDLRPSLLVDADPLASVRWEEGERGTLMLVMDSTPREITLEADTFDAYLLEEGLSDVIAARAGRGGPGRERYSRCLKSILARGRAGRPVATQVIGQDLEIVPEQDPLTLAEGAELPLRVLFRGEPLAGAEVIAARRDDSGEVRTWKGRTDAHGRFVFKLDGAGVYLVRLVHMTASAEAGADWRSWWSSLTFPRR